MPQQHWARPLWEHNEHLGALHRTSDRNNPAHAGAARCRRGRLQSLAGRGLAERGHPDAFGYGEPARCRPQTMASSVAQPLERQFADLPGVTQITSINVLGNTQITLQFDLSRSIDGAASDVQGAINAAEGSLPKIFLTRQPTARPILPIIPF